MSVIRTVRFWPALFGWTVPGQMWENPPGWHLLPWHFAENHGTDRDITLSTCSCLFIIYCYVLLYNIIYHNILYTGSFWSNSLWMQHDWQKHIFSCCSLGLLQAVNWFVAHSGQALLLLLMSQSQEWLENRTYLEPPLGFCLTKKTCSLYVDSLNCQMLDFPLGE
jgi:hypothetical protein